MEVDLPNTKMRNRINSAAVYSVENVPVDINSNSYNE